MPTNPRASLAMSGALAKTQFLTAFGTHTATSSYRDSFCPFNHPVVPPDLPGKPGTLPCAFMGGGLLGLAWPWCVPFLCSPSFMGKTSVNFLAMSLVRVTRVWVRGYGRRRHWSKSDVLYVASYVACVQLLNDMVLASLFKKK